MPSVAAWTSPGHRTLLLHQAETFRRRHLQETRICGKGRVIGGKHPHHGLAQIGLFPRSAAYALYRSVARGMTSRTRTRSRPWPRSYGGRTRQGRDKGRPVWAWAPASGCWPACRSRSDGCSWPASRPPCWRAATARRSCCCTARWATRPTGCAIIPGLVASHRVVVPDLPGHGASEVGDGSTGRRTGAGVARRADRADLRNAASRGGATARRRHRRPLRHRPGRAPEQARARGHVRPPRVRAGT